MVYPPRGCLLGWGRRRTSITRISTIKTERCCETSVTLCFLTLCFTDKRKFVARNCYPPPKDSPTHKKAHSIYELGYGDSKTNIITAKCPRAFCKDHFLSWMHVQIQSYRIECCALPPEGSSPRTMHRSKGWIGGEQRVKTTLRTGCRPPPRQGSLPTQHFFRQWNAANEWKCSAHVTRTLLNH